MWSPRALNPKIGYVGFRVPGYGAWKVQSSALELFGCAVTRVVTKRGLKGV